MALQIFHPPARAPWRTAGLRPYGAAAAISAAFILLRLALEPVLQGQVPLLVLLAAPLLTCWYFGFAPALLATLLCALFGEWLFVAPRFDAVPQNPVEWVRLGVFLLYALVFSWLIDTRHRALHLLLREREDLIAARDELARREQQAREAARQAEADKALLLAARAAAGESDAMFRTLSDNIAQLAWMTDETGFIRWYNRRWFEYTGTTSEQMKASDWRQVHHPEHMDRVLAKFRRHMGTGEPWEDTFPLRRHDGEYRWFLSRAFPLRDRAGRIVSWFGTNTDIHAQHQAEEALRQADRRKDEFISVLAHELRNPLAPVRNAVEILKRVAQPEPRVERARDVIARQVAHMVRLIDDLLDVSRIARGKLTLRKERCDLAAIARQTAEDYRASLQAAGQQLELHQPPGPAWVEGDPVRLAQMLGNLLTNAARFTNGPGTVRVRTAVDEAGRSALLTVQDTGVGLPPELLGRLFDPFEQAAQDSARTQGGLGLGLALTKGLAELHGGSVSAESAGPGQGASFTLRIPLSPEQPPAVPRGEARPAEPQARRILVVEDNPDAAATLGELLQLGGHQVEVAHDGRSGVAAARALRPDVVISDLGLPGEVDGYALARALRQEPALAGTRLIALSGYADEQARRRCREAGYDTHLPKPPDLAALDRAIEAAGGQPA
ncbi:hybrid sensor histidine kinase/response regulator [Ramlibacter tataouinensis]|nr:ATP-binding protein [Ramlibacter tataouinensis]